MKKKFSLDNLISTVFGTYEKVSDIYEVTIALPSATYQSFKQGIKVIKKVREYKKEIPKEYR